MIRRKILYGGLFFFMVLIVTSINCAARSYSLSSGSLNTSTTFGGIYLSASDIPGILPPAGEEKGGTNLELNRYKEILEQEYEFEPPITILLIIPAKSYYDWYYYYGYDVKYDSFNQIILNELSTKLKKTGYVGDVKLGTSIFNFSTIQSLQDIAARYRADECLFLSYDMLITQPTQCLGLWPASYLVGALTSETMLIDTRTGFFLTGGRYSHAKRTGLSAVIKQEWAATKELELMKLVIDGLADTIVADISKFYKSQ